MKESVWKQTLNTSLDDILDVTSNNSYLSYLQELREKRQQGYAVSVADLWGRVLEHQLLKGHGEGETQTLSSLRNTSNFTSFNVPIPLFTALGVDPPEVDWMTASFVKSSYCQPLQKGTVWEFSPWEFGSWDSAVTHFMDMKFLGSRPDEPCTTGFDSLSFLLGTASDFLSWRCCGGKTANSVLDPQLLERVAGLCCPDHHDGGDFLHKQASYSLIPNPFTKNFYQSIEPKFNKTNILQLIDGGENDDNWPNSPILPLLEPHRKVKVIVMSDSSGDNSNFPTGHQLVELAKLVNKPDRYLLRMKGRMPKVPESTSDFIAQGLNKRPVIFSSPEPRAVTIIYLPNTNYTFASNTSTEKVGYTQEETDSMIANGVQIATDGHDPVWPICVACAISRKHMGMPFNDLTEECVQSCSKYFWPPLR
jgi:lysophospholipase